MRQGVCIGKKRHVLFQTLATSMKVCWRIFMIVLIMILLDILLVAFIEVTGWTTVVAVMWVIRGICSVVYYYSTWVAIREAHTTPTPLVYATDRLTMCMLPTVHTYIIHTSCRLVKLYTKSSLWRLLLQTMMLLLLLINLLRIIQKLLVGVIVTMWGIMLLTPSHNRTWIARV